MSAALRRPPPAGSPIGLAALWRVVRERDPALALAEGLRELVARPHLAFFASGREALRVAAAELARRSGRDELVVPAYTCFSVAAAAIAAGARVRLVDVDATGRIDAAALEALPLERAAAVVVCNLFGVPEPVAPVARLAAAAGAAVVDDAAQALGARGADGPVGGRGDVGVLSFARGKPLSALGGGALAWGDGFDAPEMTPPAPRRLRALVRACANNVALSSLVFPWLERIPALGVGQTVFDPGFERGAIGGGALVLGAALVSRAAADGAARAATIGPLAERLRAETECEPIVAAPGDAGVYPRLAVLAPDASRRDRALVALRARGLGASALYPSALDEIAALRPHLAAPTPALPGARRLAARLLTLAVPAAAARGQAIVETLARS